MANPNPNPEGRLANLTPGNPNATGRTPNWLRKRMREGMEPYVERIISVGTTEKVSVGEAAKAIDVLGKYALGEKRFDLNDEELVAEINRFSAAWFNERSMPELYDSWFQGLREHFKALEGRSG